MLDIHHEVASGRIDQLGQGRERRLAPTGLISADHALRDTRSEGQFRLRHPRTDPSPPQQAPGRFICATHNADYSGLSITRRVRCQAALYPRILPELTFGQLRTSSSFRRPRVHLST